MKGYSVIIPTYNEPAITKLLSAISMLDNCYEIIVVDESTDDTPLKVLQFAKKNKKVKLIRRIEQEKDLSQSIILGIKNAKGQYIATIDGDGQHPIITLERLYERLIKDTTATEYDVAIAVRFPPYHKNFKRELFSRLGIMLANTRIRCRTTDALSGCFMANTEYLKENIPRFNKVRGYKILFEILKSGIYRNPAYEVPIVLRLRNAGESKLSKKQILYFVRQLLL